MATEPFLINPKRKRRISSLLSKLSHRRKMRKNPLGEEVLILGMNPKRRRKHSNPWYDDSTGHRKAAKKGWRTRGRSKRKVARVTKRKRHYKKRQLSFPFLGTAPHRYASMNPRRRRKSGLSHNPRRQRSMRRHNPVALSLGGVQSSFTRALPLAITGGASIVVTNIAPGLLGVRSPWAVYGVQVATAVGGGIAVGKFIGREHGTIWTVAGLATIVAGLLNQYVVPQIVGSVAAAGFSEGPIPEQEGYGAVPSESGSYGGFEDGFGAYVREAY